jgi:hypothetical protein
MESRRRIPQRPRAESLTSPCREALASGLRKVLSSEREASSFGPPRSRGVHQTRANPYRTRRFRKTNQRLAGRSARRLMYQGNQVGP